MTAYLYIVKRILLFGCGFSKSVEPASSKFVIITVWPTFFLFKVTDQTQWHCRRHEIANGLAIPSLEWMQCPFTVFPEAPFDRRICFVEVCTSICSTAYSGHNHHPRTIARTNGMRLLTIVLLKWPSFLPTILKPEVLTSAKCVRRA